MITIQNQSSKLGYQVILYEEGYALIHHEARPVRQTHA